MDNTSFSLATLHPFDDGNGRPARVMMNAELSASGECRIIVPTVFRQDYLDGLRRLSRQHDPSVFIKAMRFAHDFTSSIDFSDDETARRMLTQANAFNEPDSADRLRIPEQPRILGGPDVVHAIVSKLRTNTSGPPRVNEVLPPQIRHRTVR